MSSEDTIITKDSNNPEVQQNGIAGEEEEDDSDFVLVTRKKHEPKPRYFNKQQHYYNDGGGGGGSDDHHHHQHHSKRSRNRKKKFGRNEQENHINRENKTEPENNHVNKEPDKEKQQLPPPAPPVVVLPINPNLPRPFASVVANNINGSSSQNNTATRSIINNSLPANKLLVITQAPSSASSVVNSTQASAPPPVTPPIQAPSSQIAPPPIQIQAPSQVSPSSPPVEVQPQVAVSPPPPPHSSTCSINDTSSLTSDDSSTINKPLVEYVEAPPPKVNPWFKKAQVPLSNNSPGSTTQVPSQVNKINDSPTTTVTDPVKKSPEKTAVLPEEKKPAKNEKVRHTSPKPDKSDCEGKLNDEQYRYYYREMANGFRPGRGRGSIRTMASRAQVLMMKALKSENDWPALGQEQNDVNEPNALLDHACQSVPEQQTPKKQSSISSNPSPPPKESLEQNNVNVSNKKPHQESEYSSEDDNDPNAQLRRNSKQRWVPLDITESKGPKYHNKSNRKPGYYKSWRGKENGYHHQDYSDYPPPTSKYCHYCFLEMNNHAYQQHRRSAPPPLQPPHHHNSPRSLGPNNNNNNGSSRGRRSRSTGLGRQQVVPLELQQQPPLSPENVYSPDFATLTPMYPTHSAEFIMPYLGNGYFAAPLTPPPQPIPPPPPQQIEVEVETVTGKLMKQIEYYFSEENLEKDFYLRRQMDPTGFLPLAVLLSFPRVLSMTTEPSVVLSAIQCSTKLELSTDNTCVRTVYNPTHWPLLQELPTSTSSTNNNVYAATDSLFNTLNPNVPEFIPKSSSSCSSSSDVVV